MIVSRLNVDPGSEIGDEVHARNQGLLTDLKGMWSMLMDIGSVKLFYVITRIILSKLWRTLWYWNTTEDRLLAYVKKTAVEGDPASVLAAIRKYNDYEWTMALHPEKKLKTDEVVRKATPEICFEMGCYVGLSAITVASQIPPGGRLITVEYVPKIADVARELVHFAGLDQVITVITGTAEDAIKVLRSEYHVDKLDFVFVDHCKWQYLPDLKLLEKERLLRKGTIIMADDMLWPGAPDYLEYVENDPKYQTERFNCKAILLNVPVAMAISVYQGED
ncbi:catechol O-methyltransferase-like [Patiria miniata]|uniref:catechol O-methyltransferase n=1 Tax=Patiria miniata TaxID=46514 RepID=A0A914ACD0_PATMI|nr:catechol O-methyltransferase-like [Patiria miniata]